MAFSAVREQTFTWPNVDPDLLGILASLWHNDLMKREEASPVMHLVNHTPESSLTPTPIPQTPPISSKMS